MVYALAPEPAARISKIADGSRMRKDILREQAERHDGLVSRFQAEPQNDRGGRRQVAVGGELPAIGNRNAKTLVLIAEPEFGIQHLTSEEIAADGAEGLPIAIEVDVGLRVDFLAGAKSQRFLFGRQLDIADLNRGTIVDARQVDFVAPDRSIRAVDIDAVGEVDVGQKFDADASDDVRRRAMLARVLAEDRIGLPAIGLAQDGVDGAGGER